MMIAGAMIVITIEFMRSREPSSPPDPAAIDVAAPRGCSNFKLRQLTRSVSRHYDTVMAAGCGLKASQYSLLSHVALLSPVRPADLAARMGLEPSTLTRNLQPLVVQGWVQLGPGEDGRSRLVHITDTGRAKRSEAQRVWKKAQLAFNARLGEQRVAQLHALLDDCMAVLGSDGQGD
jgi:DNA-binding MarR family transcriptional regulator